MTFHNALLKNDIPNIIYHNTDYHMLSQEYFKLLGKAHVIEIISHLAKSKDGLNYNDIYLKILKSNVNPRLKELVKMEIVRQDQLKKYHITKLGRELYEVANRIENLKVRNGPDE